jgi:hypothetical protein
MDNFEILLGAIAMALFGLFLFWAAGSAFSSWRVMRRSVAHLPLDLKQNSAIQSVRNTALGFGAAGSFFVLLSIWLALLWQRGVKPSPQRPLEFYLIFQEHLIVMIVIVAVLALLIFTGKNEQKYSLRWLLRNGAASVLGIALFVFFLGFVGFLFHPWSYTVTGRPTLTGDWTGQLETKVGIGISMFLKLRLNMASVLSEDGGPCLVGTALVCNDGGQVAAYDVVGNARDGGTKFRLSFYTGWAKERRFLAAFQGVWEATTLKLSGKYEPIEAESLPASATLITGERKDFDLACQRPAIGKALPTVP